MVAQWGRGAVSRLRTQDWCTHWFTTCPQGCCLPAHPIVWGGTQGGSPYSKPDHQPQWAEQVLHTKLLNKVWMKIDPPARPRSFGHPKYRRQGAGSVPATRFLQEVPTPSLLWAFRIRLGLMALFSTAPTEVKGEEECGTLTTSVFVILARRSVRLSPSSSWRPQMAAPTLPVAIIDGGYRAKLKSARTDLGISPSPDKKSCKTSEASNIKKTTPKNKKRGSREREKCHSFWSGGAH